MKTNEQSLNNLNQIGSIPRFLLKGEGGLRLWELAGSGLSLINSFFIISSLSLHQFGLYQLVLSSIGIVGGFNLDSFDGVVSVEMRHSLNKGETAVARRLFLEYVLVKILLAVVLVALIFAGAIAADHYGDNISLLLRLASVVLILEALQSLQRIFFKSVFSFAYFGASAMRELGKFLPLLYFFYISSLTLTKVVSIHMAGLFISLLFMSFLFFKNLKSKPNWLTNTKNSIRGKYLIPSLVKLQGKWIFLKYGFARLTKNTTPWLIKLFINTEAVALYSVAVNLVAMIVEFFPVNMVPYVYLARIGDKKELRHLFNKSVKYIFWFGIALGLVVFLIVPPLGGVILPKYQQAMPLFQVMIVVLPVYGVYKLVKSILTVLREYKILTMRILVEAVILWVSLIVLLPVLGLYGAAISYIIVYLGRISFLYPALVKKYPHLSFRINNLFQFDRYDKDFLQKWWYYISSILVIFLNKKLKSLWK